MNVKAEPCSTKTCLWDGHSGLLVWGQDAPFLNSLPIVNYLGVSIILLLIVPAATDIFKRVAFFVSSLNSLPMITFLAAEADWGQGENISVPCRVLEGPCPFLLPGAPIPAAVTTAFIC